MKKTKELTKEQKLKKKLKAEKVKVEGFKGYLIESRDELKEANGLLDKARSKHLDALVKLAKANGENEKLKRDIDRLKVDVSVLECRLKITDDQRNESLSDAINNYAICKSLKSQNNGLKSEMDYLKRNTSQFDLSSGDNENE